VAVHQSCHVLLAYSIPDCNWCLVAHIPACICEWQMHVYIMSNIELRFDLIAYASGCSLLHMSAEWDPIIGTGLRRLAAMHICIVRCRLCRRMHGASVVGFSACYVLGFNFWPLWPRFTSYVDSSWLHQSCHVLLAYSIPDCNRCLAAHIPACICDEWQMHVYIMSDIELRFNLIGYASGCSLLHMSAEWDQSLALDCGD
jgi:hypothetical protein